MATQRVAAVAAGVALPLTTETAIVTLTPQAPNNQVTPGSTVLIRFDVTITGAASATNCTFKLRRGAGLTGTDILASDPVLTVAASAVDEGLSVTVTETAANFNTANGIYTLSGNAAGAAQTARLASLEEQVLSAGV